jgi:hypothetical protein
MTDLSLFENSCELGGRASAAGWDGLSEKLKTAIEHSSK